MFVQNATHFAGDETFNSIVDSVHSITPVDTVPHEGSSRGVHAARRSTDMHDGQRESTTLRDKQKQKTSVAPFTFLHTNNKRNNKVQAH